MSEKYELSELEDVAELLELVEEGVGKATVTMGGADRFVVMTAERYRALSDGYAQAREKAQSLAEQLEAAQQATAELEARLQHAPVQAAAATAAPAADAPAPQPQQAAQAAAPSGETACASERARSYKTAGLPNTPIDADDYQRSMWQDAIVERMTRVIDAEAPVEKQRLFNTVRASFGIKRSGRDIQSHNEWLFNRRINAKQTEFNGSTFVWRSDQDPAAYDIFRPNDEAADRQITEYPYEELLAAIKAALCAQERLSRDDLIEAAMRLLGYKRKTTRVRDVLGAAIEHAAEDGAIRIFTDGTFRIAS